ncbi:hypothetical protein BOTCAL_0158g00130 [Botryotinia calthae]|uniref:Uncharacterized protein n=1 Tax=Botryotinia calthae TaxID=38488 RepID=A0A4Y8D432_9HELO|nr:hypothetical protein BOTCAL_0158g00130 [Botryotinia calthae]
MDLPRFTPQFIQLQNKHPSRTESYNSSMFWETAIHRLARHTVSGKDQKVIIDNYKAKCVEYYGDTVNHSYFMYAWNKSISNYFFPGKKFVGSDPDPVYSEVFAQYFNEQAQVRDEMNECGVHATEQVDILTSLSKIYNNQLQLARRPPKYSLGNISVSANRASDQSTVPTMNHEGSDPGNIPSEDYDTESPELRRLMENAVTKIMGDELEGNWVMVNEIRDDDWIMVESESR